MTSPLPAGRGTPVQPAYRPLWPAYPSKWGRACSQGRTACPAWGFPALALERSVTSFCDAGHHLRDPLTQCRRVRRGDRHPLAAVRGDPGLAEIAAALVVEPGQHG